MWGLVVLYPHGEIRELTLSTETGACPPTTHRALDSVHDTLGALLRGVWGTMQTAGGQGVVHAP